MEAVAASLGPLNRWRAAHNGIFSRKVPRSLRSHFRDRVIVSATLALPQLLDASPPYPDEVVALWAYSVIVDSFDTPPLGQREEDLVRKPHTMLVFLVDAGPAWHGVATAVTGLVYWYCLENADLHRTWRHYFVIDTGCVDGVRQQVCIERAIGTGELVVRFYKHPNPGTSTIQSAIPHLCTRYRPDWQMVAFVDLQEDGDQLGSVCALMLNMARPLHDPHRITDAVLVRLAERLYLRAQALADAIVADTIAAFSTTVRSPTSSPRNGRVSPRSTWLAMGIFFSLMAQTAATTWGREAELVLAGLFDAAQCGYRNVGVRFEEGGELECLPTSDADDFLRFAYLELLCADHRPLSDEAETQASRPPHRQSRDACRDPVAYLAAIRTLRTSRPENRRQRHARLPDVSFDEHLGIVAFCMARIRRLCRGWIDPAHYNLHTVSGASLDYRRSLELQRRGHAIAAFEQRPISFRDHIITPLL